MYDAERRRGDRDAGAYSGDVVTLYGHLDRLLVTSGQVVQTGQPIGLEGSTGNSTGPHVHFEVRLGGTPVNPFDHLAVGAL
jgi:murein DD-endopeptidase MepM/ murein hydrolase activator NlpD